VLLRRIRTDSVWQFSKISMARANRHHLPGYIWHITHRCHKREFLLKFEKDKKNWMKWLFEAKKRFGLSVLNYCVTSNHIHLLVYDDKEGTLPKSIQLIAGRVGREYNTRKNRTGAYWEDRYHATAVMAGDHLIQCIAYIDLNMVRAGVVRHPSQWKFCGYNEIQNPRQRYRLIDRGMLCHSLGIENSSRLAAFHRSCVDELLRNGLNKRVEKWTESIAIGDEDFISRTKASLGAKAVGRKLMENSAGYELKELQAAYNRDFTAEKCALRFKNEYFWRDLS